MTAQALALVEFVKENFGKIATGEVDKARFQALIKEARHGFFGVELDPLDGETHGITDIGGWLGSQMEAARFMHMAEQLGLIKTVEIKGYGLAMLETGAFNRLMQGAYPDYQP